VRFAHSAGGGGSLEWQDSNSRLGWFNHHERAFFEFVLELVKRVN
jgi:hypothetical protein